MRALLLITSVLIFYGSIYPLNFSIHTYSPERMAQLVDFRLDGGSRGNIIANILLFVPFGLFSVFATRGGDRASGTQIALLSLAGFVLAYLAQLAQVFIAGRVPSGVDVVWNLVGMLAGLLVGLALARSHRRLPTLAGPLPIPLVLVGGWLAYQWIPFVPTLDLGLLRDNALAFFARRTPSPFWVFQNTVLWLVCYQLVARYAPGIRLGWYPLATLVVLGMGGLLIGSTVNVDDLIGAACALILWRVLDGRWYPGWLSLLLALAIVGASYLSLTLRETPASFSWIPFSGSLGGNIVINVIATWKKLVLYGLLVWLLLEARLSVLRASASAALLLFVSEWFQVYVQGATPEITDALLALGIGAAIAVRGEQPRRALGADIGAARPTGVAARRKGWLPAIGIAVFLTAAAGLMSTALPEGPTAVIRSDVPWSGQRANLIADLHLYSSGIDGSPEASERVSAAAASGCTVLAISDRSGASPPVEQQRRTLSAMRGEHPELLLFLGVGMDTPSYPDRERMKVLLHPEQEAEWLSKLHQAVNRTADGARGGSQDTQRRFLRLVKRIRDAGHRSFLIYNLPSHEVTPGEASLQDLVRWRSLGTRVDAIGTDSRRGPAATVAGGIWDQYLASGGDVWTALTSTGVQDSGGDGSPCKDSRIHIAAPERSHGGVLDALDAGTFWVDHGRLLNHLALEVEFDGIAGPLYPGESADVFTENSAALARVVLERGPASLEAPLAVELISSCIDGNSQVITRQLAPGQSRAESLIPLQATGDGDSSCIIRARVSMNQYGTDPRLFAYTNYVRVNLRLGVLDGGILDWRLK